MNWSWHGAFTVLVLAGAVWTVCWFWFSERLPLRRPAGSGSAATTPDPNGHLVVPFHRLLALRSFWGLVLLSFAGYLISSLKVAWLPAYLSEGLGYPAGTVGVLAAIPYAAAVAVLLSAGALSGWLLRRGRSSHLARGQLTGAYLVLGGLSMVAFTLLDAGPLQVVLVVLAFAVNSVAFSVAFAGASDFLPARQRVAFFGCIIAAYSVAGVLAPYGLGLIVDRAPTPAQGYATGFFVVGLVVCALGVLGGAMLNPERARSELERLSMRGGGS